MLINTSPLKLFCIKQGIYVSKLLAVILTQPWCKPFSHLIFPKQQKKLRRQLAILLMDLGEIKRACRLIKAYPLIHPDDILLMDRLKEMDRVLHSSQPLEKTKNTTTSTTKKTFNNCILLVLHHSLPYDTAGYAIRSHMIAKQLKQKNITATVLTRPGYPFDLQKHPKKLHTKTNNMVDHIDGINYCRLPGSNTYTLNRCADTAYTKYYANLLSKKAKEHDASVIHAASNYLNGHAAIQAANTLGLRSVYEIRGLWYLSALAKYPFLTTNTPSIIYRQIMEANAAIAADTTIVISDALRNYITTEWQIPNQKISVIPNAVDTELFQPIPQNLELKNTLGLEGRLVVGFLGSLTTYERVDIIIEAVTKLIKKGAKLSLLIVGTGYEKNRLMKLAKHLNQQHIRFTGQIPFHQVKEYYSIFDICPLPRTNLLGTQLIPPLKILESMALSKAVIVSDLPCLREMVINEQTGLICQPDNVDSLAQAIENLYEDKKLKQTLGKNARQWVLENRSWSAISNRFYDIYNKY